MTAFIPTNHADMAIAAMAARHMRSLGWHTILLASERDFPCGPPEGGVLSTHDEQGWGMYGNWCAYEILRKMDEHTPADCGVVIKLDADVFLTIAGEKWLADCAMTGKAHCMRLEGCRIHRSEWGGIWSAPRAALATMAESAKFSRACRCPESQLCIGAAGKTIGLASSPFLTAQVWGACDHSKHCGALTLPIKTNRGTRMEDAAAMFDFRG